MVAVFFLSSNFSLDLFKMFIFIYLINFREYDLTLTLITDLNPELDASLLMRTSLEIATKDDRSNQCCHWDEAELCFQVSMFRCFLFHQYIAFISEHYEHFDVVFFFAILPHWEV